MATQLDNSLSKTFRNIPLLEARPHPPYNNLINHNPSLYTNDN